MEHLAGRFPIKEIATLSKKNAMGRGRRGITKESFKRKLLHLKRHGIIPTPIGNFTLSSKCLDIEPINRSEGVFNPSLEMIRVAKLLTPQQLAALIPNRKIFFLLGKKRFQSYLRFLKALD